MAAKSGGGTAGRRSMRDKEMAAYMKAHKVERHTANCPMCHRLVGRQTDRSSGSMYFHILQCKGR